MECARTGEGVAENTKTRCVYAHIGSHTQRCARAETDEALIFVMEQRPGLKPQVAPGRNISESPFQVIEELAFLCRNMCLLGIHTHPTEEVGRG